MTKPKGMLLPPTSACVKPAVDSSGVKQQGALQSLQSLKQGLQQQQQQAGAGQGKGLPRPFASGSRRGQGNGRENEDKALKLPDEDPNKASRELRQDVMEAMKQGAPDRYRDQNKRYYEELVK
jgi:hypothetical protein